MSERNDIEILGLLERIGTLEQLLEVYEKSVVDSSDRLYAEQERLRCQGEASLDGVLSIGTGGEVLFSNRRLAEMWGVAPSAIEGSDADEVFRALAARTTAPAAFLARIAELERGDESREEIALRNGRTFEQYTARIRSQPGTDFGRVWHYRDITDFKEVGRLKDELISSVSHELRTPLTSIKGALDLMANGVVGRIPDDALALVKVAQNNCARLVRLVSDVLDIEKIEAGRMEWRVEVVELEPLLAQSLEAIRPYGAGLDVQFRLESSAPGARVRVDPDRLLQVLENLLSNAAKYSPPGGTVEVTLVERGPSLRISVTDHGPGIAPELRARLFDKFAQGTTRDPQQKQGTGLGLNIARAIVERLGGTIGFVSTAGVGTTFPFDLPRLDTAPETAP
jgi:signal transduction histidine kinase